LTPPSSASPGFLRAVSRWEVVALSVNSVIGSGVYLVLPVAAAQLLGAASVWAILAGGFAVLLIVLCFAEASSLFDRPGGAYVYAREAFGEFAGFEVGWMTWVARVAAVASLSVFFSRVLGYVWDGANHGIGQALTVVAELAVLTWLNVRGVKTGARTTVFLTVGKTLPLLVLVLAGVFAISWNRVFPVPGPDPGKLPQAALLVLFAYAGFESTPGPAGEYRNPRRDLPFALIVQLAIVTGLYTLVQLVAIGTVPDLGVSKTPLADAGRILMGTAGALLLTIGAAVSVLGTNNGSILTGPRYLYVLAESGRLPRVFSKIHPRYHTPYVAILTQSGVAFALIATDAVLHAINPTAFGVAEDLALISVIARLATYIGTCLAVPVLRRKLPATPRTVRLPGGPAIPIAALLVCLVLLSAVQRKVFIAGGIALLVGAIVYAWPRRRESRPLSVLRSGTES
jgi:amino acid transporter